MYEKFLNEQLLHLLIHSLFDFMSAYRKGCSTNHVFIRLLKIGEKH